MKNTSINDKLHDPGFSLVSALVPFTLYAVVVTLVAVFVCEIWISAAPKPAMIVLCSVICYLSAAMALVVTWAVRRKIGISQIESLLGMGLRAFPPLLACLIFFAIMEAERLNPMLLTLAGFYFAYFPVEIRLTIPKITQANETIDQSRANQ